jgi:hypothetical protein
MAKREYGYQKESEGYSIWTIGLSGSRQDVVGYARSKRDAQRKVDKLYAQDENAEREARKASTAAGPPRHHSTMKKSPAQLQREIDDALSRRKPRGFAPGDPNRDDYLRFLDDVNDPPRTDLIRAHKADRIREMDKPARKSKMSHATMTTDDVPSSTGKPSKEKLQQAAKWIRRELTKRDDSSHPSHLANKVLEEADEKFGLGSFGVEGWAKSPSIGYQYLNYGDSYDPTIVVRSNPTRATVFVALGGWASYA